MTYIEDEDPIIRKEMAELESLAESFRSDAYNCRVTDEFLDNIGNIGGLYRKYTQFTYLPKASQSAKRFDSAIRKVKDAKQKFVRDCDCKQIK